MSSKKELLRAEYIGRVNKAIDYIHANLDNELSLDKIAEASYFSKFHFHRIFSSIQGETVNSFIKRTRLGKAALMLVSNHKESIADIAYSCGFSSPPVFTRSFKDHFGFTPAEFRENPVRNMSKEYSKNYQLISKNKQEVLGSSQYIAGVNDMHYLQIIKELSMNVTIKDLPEQKIAYVRHKGNYSKIGEAFEKLMVWAGPRGLLQMPKTQIYGVYYDSPQLTEENLLTSDACITIDREIEPEGEIGIGKIQAGKYACAHMRIKESEFSAAWDKVFSEWLPESGWQPDDMPSFEHYLNDPKDDPENMYELEICVPVKPL